MSIHCIGLNHTTAPLALREQLAFSEEQIRAALARQSCHHSGQTSTITELLILSTCNRTEMYAVSSQRNFSALEDFLAATRGVDVGKFHTHLYRIADMEAVSHLFQVSAGLNSLVLGEPQILGQVTRAFELARGVGSAGPLLSRLFQNAIHAGKRVRTETAIARNPASVSSLAASVAEKSLGNLQTASVVVLGAGEMAELTVEALRQRGVIKIRVINRTLERAMELAQRWGAEASTFESLENSLCTADILISSTGAPHTLISAEMVRAAHRARLLVLVDIAVPRDIDPACADLPLVQLFDMDSLNAHLEESLAERAAEVPQAQRILAEEEARFGDFLHSLEMLPLITTMRQQAEEIRLAELEKTLRRMPHLSPQERARIEAMTQALVKKLLESPTRRLRAEATCPHAPEYATVARTLFGLEQGDSLCGFSGTPCSVSTAAD